MSEKKRTRWKVRKNHGTLIQTQRTTDSQYFLTTFDFDLQQRTAVH